MASAWLAVTILHVTAFGVDPPTGCSAELVQAERSASHARSWSKMIAAYRAYARCDDGGEVSEAFSDSVGYLLGKKGLDELADLVRRDPAFLSFVLRHVGDITPKDQSVAIRRNVTARCPESAREVCRAVRRRIGK
jgi:hypothetical protein